MRTFFIILFFSILMLSIFFDQFLIICYQTAYDLKQWKNSFIEKNAFGMGRLWNFFDERFKIRYIFIYVSLIGLLISLTGRG